MPTFEGHPAFEIPAAETQRAEIEASIADALRVGDGFRRQRADIEADRTLSAMGQRGAVREAAASARRELDGIASRVETAYLRGDQSAGSVDTGPGVDPEIVRDRWARTERLLDGGLALAEVIGMAIEARDLAWLVAIKPEAPYAAAAKSGSSISPTLTANEGALLDAEIEKLLPIGVRRARQIRRSLASTREAADRAVRVARDEVDGRQRNVAAGLLAAGLAQAQAIREANG